MMDNDHDRQNNLPELVNREEAYAALTTGLVERRDPCLYVYGPKGTGKTLLVQNACRELPDDVTVCALSCIRHDTQYKVLTTLCNTVADGDFTTGYHTAQLYNTFTDALTGQELVLILDDLDFLLLNDGSDLLYTLSRLNQQAPRLVLVSAAHPNPATELEERTYSSLQPTTVHCTPYTDTAAVRILRHRIDNWVAQPVTDAAIHSVAAATTNIHVGYHWLTAAAEITEGRITADIIDLVRDDAVERYRTAQLAAFSQHHRLLLDAIQLLAAETEPVHSGAVYDWYEELCSQTGTTPLSTRRISDFLKHLELLDLIRAEYHYGGDAGKTRKIWLQEV